MIQMPTRAVRSDTERSHDPPYSSRSLSAHFELNMTLPSPDVLGAVYCVSELCLAFTKHSPVGNHLQRPRFPPLLWAVIAGSIALGVTLAHALPFAALPHARTCYFVGIGFYAFGLLLRWYSVMYLGRFFTVDVAIHADHQLIDPSIV